LADEPDPPDADPLEALERDLLAEPEPEREPLEPDELPDLPPEDLPPDDPLERLEPPLPSCCAISFSLLTAFKV
jgi:hypothetical protein